jgi:hypothetical protein
MYTGLPQQRARRQAEVLMAMAAMSFLCLFPFLNKIFPDLNRI